MTRTIRSVLLLTLTALASSNVQAAFRFFDPSDRDAVPGLLSQTGVYSDILAKTPDTALKPFEINAVLWSDGAAKQRGIILPPGRQVAYQDSSDLFDYPDSTVFVKTFLLERVQGDSGSLVHWETRLLMNRRDASGRNVWHGFSYKWNASATDADLVDREAGYDTAFYYHPEGPSRPQSYKKWHFPSQSECNTCHRVRHVLGFLPAQLKRPDTENPSVNQVLRLFQQGVFSGTAPGEEQLKRRWKGMREPIPSGLTAEQRFAVLDSMARSYLGANCSGCHGDRGIAQGAAPAFVNFDFYKLFPAMELGHAFSNPLSLDNEDTAWVPVGRPYFIEAVTRAGLDTSVGQAWNMSRPESPGQPALLYPGSPAYSALLYRQVVRRAAWRDSMELRHYLQLSGDPQGWLPWMFSQPWGSQPWRQDLAAHNLDPGRVLVYEKDGGQLGGQMPPLASSFIPDRQALTILGEWVRNYRTLYVVDTGNIVPGAARHVGRPEPGAPRLSGRTLVLPGDWTGEVLLADLQGRRHRLTRLGKGRFLIPESVRPGVHFIRAGGKTGLLYCCNAAR